MRERDTSNSSSTEAATASAEAPSLSILDCLHPSLFNDSDADGASASTLDAERCFRILLRLLCNHRQHPSDPAYASFPATSTAWQNGVLPCVYVLRLVAWMGCAPNTEGSRYAFKTTSSSAGEEHLRALDARIEELECVVATWSTPVASLRRCPGVLLTDGSETNACTRVAPEPATERDKSECFDQARAALIKLYAHAGSFASAVPSDTYHHSITRSLQIRVLRLASCALLTAVEPNPPISTSGLPPNLCEWSLAEEDSSVSWLLQHASLCQLTRVCQDAASAAAAAAASSRPANLSSPTTCLPSSSAAVAVALVERFREQARVEQHQRYLESTGPAYRRLSQEERHRGESVVIDIASLLEQLALVTETQGMVRVDRQEARRLLDAFKQDGDLVKLYTLQEQYTLELEEAKVAYGKPLVFAEYE